MFIVKRQINHFKLRRSDMYLRRRKFNAEGFALKRTARKFRVSPITPRCRIRRKYVFDWIEWKIEFFARCYGENQTFRVMS